MRKPLILIAATMALAACGSSRATLDEFAVSRNAPLIIPPDYTLEPPRAGTVSQSATETQQQAVEALFPPAPRTAGETSLLNAAGQQDAVVGARSIAGDPGTRVVDKGADTQAIIASGETDNPDATAEAPQ